MVNVVHKCWTHRFICLDAIIALIFTFNYSLPSTVITRSSYGTLCILVFSSVLYRLSSNVHGVLSGLGLLSAYLFLFYLTSVSIYMSTSIVFSKHITKHSFDTPLSLVISDLFPTINMTKIDSQECEMLPNQN